jgi:hypothetical protein
MNAFLAFLAKIEGVEMALLQAKIPIISTGIGGEILSVSLVAETELSQILSVFSKPTATAPVTTTTTTTPSAPVAAPAVVAGVTPVR